MATATIVSEVFLPLARLEAKSLGMEGLRLIAVPHPMAARDDEDAEAIARERVDAALAALENQG